MDRAARINRRVRTNRITRLATATVLGLGISSSVATAAFAGTTTTTAPPAQGQSATPSSAMATWTTARRQINTDFHSALASARQTYTAALAAASTPADRQAAREALLAAIAAARTTRHDALVVLGPPPVAGHGQGRPGNGKAHGPQGARGNESGNGKAHGPQGTQSFGATPTITGPAGVQGPAPRQPGFDPLPPWGHGPAKK